MSTTKKKSKSIAIQSDPTVPPWLPAASRWAELPQGLRDAVPRVIIPAYRRFVLEESGELERSVGLTLVHLLWLELCGQVRLADVAGNPESLDAILNDPERMIDRHLHLASVKCQSVELLMNLRIVNHSLQHPPAPQEDELQPQITTEPNPQLAPPAPDL